MFKFNSTADWNFDYEPVRILIDTNSLIKAAADHNYLKFHKTANQTDVLVTALGAYEGTGPNRNLDAFLELDCINKVGSFLRTGKCKDGVYDGRAVNRHHKNKPEDPKYGNIKAASYNKEMRRIELVIGLDNDKCADEIQKLASGDQINVSMASKQAHDVCSWCNHKAKSDKDRCEHIPAKLGELRKDGQVCHMVNPDPSWFEISIVGRPADRVGMSLKLASTYIPKLGSDYIKLYEGFVPPTETLISKYAADKRALINKISALEKHIDGIAKEGPKTSKDLYLAREKTKLNKVKLSDDVLDELRKFDPSKLLKELADNGIVFSPEDFSKYLFGSKVDDKTINKMKSRLPNIFSDLQDDPEELGEVVNNEKFDPSPSNLIPKELKKMVEKLFDNHSMFEAPAHSRIMRITVMMGKPSKHVELSKGEEVTKEASIQELAEQYAAYKIAALNYLNDKDQLTEDFIINTLIQNR